MDRIIKGVFLAPLISVPLVNTVFYLIWLPIQRSQSFQSQLPSFLEDYGLTVLFLSLFGIPIGMLTLAIIWIPSFLALQKRGMATRTNIFRLTLLATLPAFLFFPYGLLNIMVILLLMLHGLACAAAFLRISKLSLDVQEAKANVEPN